MNPYDNVGTTRLSTSRPRPALPAGGRPTRTRTPSAASSRCARRCRRGGSACSDALIADAVAVTRATRDHPDVRQGSSVRGAIDLTLVAGELLALRGVSGGRDRATDAAQPGRTRTRVRRDARRAVRPHPPRRDGRDARPSRCCARSGRTTSSSTRPRPTPVEERSRPTRRYPAAAAATGGLRAAAPQAQAARRASRRCSTPAAGGGGGAGAAAAGPGAAPAGPGRRPGSGAPGVTDEPAELLDAPPGRRPRRPGDAAPGPADRRPAGRRRARAATRPPAAAPASWPACRYRGGSDDIDLDAHARAAWSSTRCPRTTTSSSASGCAPAARSCSPSTSPARCAASGSARPRPRSARSPAELARDDLAVIAFWSDAARARPARPPVAAAAAARRRCCASRPAG